jgi:hypothetical protein
LKGRARGLLLLLHSLLILQTAEDAKDFFKRKIDFLTKQMEKIQPALQEKHAMKQGKLYLGHLFSFPPPSLKTWISGQVLVAHAYNLSYSGGRVQEDRGLRSQPGQIVLKTLSQKTLHKNRTGGMAQSEDPEFKPQYCKKKERKKQQKNMDFSVNLRGVPFPG